MSRYLIEPLEDRCLFDGGLSAPSNPIQIADIPSQSAPFTSRVLLNGTTFISYIDATNRVVFTVVDPATGNVIIPVTAIPNVTGYSLGHLACEVDDDGSIDEIFPTQGNQSSTTFNLVRIDTQTGVAGTPVQISTNGPTGTTPAIAAGPSDQVAVLVPQYIGQSSFGALGGIFNANNQPILAPTMITGAIPDGSVRFLSDFGLSFNPSTGQCVGLVSQEDVAEPSNVVTDRLLVGLPFSASAIGTPFTIASAQNDAEAADIFGNSVFYPNDTSPTGVIVTRKNFGPAPNFTANGGSLELDPVNLTTDVVASPAVVISSTTGDSQYNVVGLATQSGFPVLTCTTATGNPNAIGCFVLDPQNPGAVLSSNQPVFSLNLSGDPYDGGNVFVYEDSTFTPTPETVITAQAATFSPPSTTTAPPVSQPSFSVEYHLLSAGNEAEFDIFLANPAKDGSDSTVNYATREGTLLEGFNYDESDGTVTLNNKDTEQTITVKLHYLPFLVSTPENFFLDLSMPGNATIQNGAGSAEAEIEGAVAPGGETDPGITKTETFTSHKTLIIKGNNDLPTTLGLKGPGTAKLVLNADQTVDVFLTGTTAQTQFVVKGDAYTIRNFTCNGPLGKVSASGVNVTGNVTVNGCNSLAFGNVKDNHLIKLGKVTNAVVTFGQVANSRLTAIGSIKSLTVADWAGGSISATTIGTIASSHDLDADLSVATIAKLSVAGSLGGTSPSDVRHLRATQSFGTITAGSIVAADIFAGAKSTQTALPTTRKQFISSTASIKSLTMTGTSPAFIDSIIAAPIIGTLKISGLDATNATRFGVVAERITSYMRDSVKAKNIFSKKKIETVGAYSAATV